MVALGVLTLLMLCGVVFFGRKMYKISEENKARIKKETEEFSEDNG